MRSRRSPRVRARPAAVQAPGSARFQRETDILDRHVLERRDMPGLGIDFDPHQMRHESRSTDLDRRTALGHDRTGTAGFRFGTFGQLADTDVFFWHAFDAHEPILEFEVIAVRLEMFRRQIQQLITHALGGTRDRTGQADRDL